MANCTLRPETAPSVLQHISSKLLICAAVTLAFSALASAQSRLPGIEVFGGYSHLTFQSRNLGFGNSTQMNGADVGISVHIVKGLGLVLDGSGHYSTPLEVFTYAVGAQYKMYELGRFQFIGHGLYGRAQTRIRDIGTTFSEPSDRHRSLIFGGEVQLPITSTISFRAIQADDVITTAFGSTQHNIRLATGISYSFGKH
jgi:hypothetical protein